MLFFERKTKPFAYYFLSISGKDEADFYNEIPIFFRELIQRLNDEDKVVTKTANTALTSITKNVPAEELVKSIEYIRNLIATVVSESRRRKGGVGDGDFFMPGFNIPKGMLCFLCVFIVTWMRFYSVVIKYSGLEPLWPIYQRGINVLRICGMIPWFIKLGI